jgi:hypothetical protein
MHRQTPLSAGFVGYSGGGSRTLIDTIDDGQLMQEMKGAMMHGEAREKVESPQNYGFTSVVRPATKDKDGKIQDCAEGFMSYAGGNRTGAFCAVMDDRRYRPLGLKPGENAQYDDVGQMTLMRRTGLYLLSNDNAEDNQQQGQSGGGSTPGQLADSGQGQQVERMVSLRHVEKKKQERPKRGGGGQSGNGSGSGGASGGGVSARADSGGSSSGSAQDYKHEGETVNTEIRATKKDIQILDGETVVGRYDKASGTWTFSSKTITLTASDSMTVECKNGTLDLKGKPIKFNGGGPETPPFQVPG